MEDRKKKNKQIRKIIFLSLDNMENSKGKNIEEKMDLFAYSTFLFFSCSFDSGFALDHLCFFFFCFVFFLIIPFFL